MVNHTESDIKSEFLVVVKDFRIDTPKIRYQDEIFSGFYEIEFAISEPSRIEQDVDSFLYIGFPSRTISGNKQGQSTLDNHIMIKLAEDDRTCESIQIRMRDMNTINLRIIGGHPLFQKFLEVCIDSQHNNHRSLSNLIS